MKNVLFTLIVCSAFYANNALAQETPSSLSNVTLGFGAGYSHILSNIDEYSLSTDTLHALKVSPASKGGFVISSVITVRLGKVASKAGDSRLYSQSKLYNIQVQKYKDDPTKYRAKCEERLTLNLAINLAEVKSDGLSFNKPIDGGLGLGYYLSSDIQVALFADFVRVRQLRPYIVSSYENQPIPKGTDVYTALDPSNNELFTTKTMVGVSVKLVYTLANHKEL